MAEGFLVLMVLLFLLAALFRQDFVVTILYLFAGVFIAGSWWSRRSINSVVCERNFTTRAFLNEQIKIRLKIINQGWLPVVWMKVHESMPVDLSIHKFFRQALTLGPHAQTEFEYTLNARKRGYYPIGPLLSVSGDLMGLLDNQQRQVSADYLTVYPKIVPLSKLILPTRSPLGTLRHNQPIFEDPSRVLSKRDYIAGDSLRRVDWKASASVGRLQVKQFEPAIALETSLFLNLNSEEYDIRTRFHSTELAIVIAASIANWVIGRKQSVGLCTNGVDPGISTGEKEVESGAQGSFNRIQSIPPRKGQAHLIRILDILARVQAETTAPFLELLRSEYTHLPWGTTIILITNQVDLPFFDQIFQIRRAGMNVMLIVTGQGSPVELTRRQAAQFSIPFFQICTEGDMDIWRR
jgi:uncharacterized protein (DUF58 family)